VTSTRIVNVASVPHRSPFRYPGGKTWLVPQVRRWLASMARKPSLLVEPFAGGAIVGLTVAFERLAESVLLAEIDADVGAVWQTVLTGRGESLARRIREFVLTAESAREVLESTPRASEDRAFAAIVRNRVRHGGIMAPGASMMKEGENGRGIGSRWYPDTIAKRLLAIGEHRNVIRFERADAFDCIERHAHDPDAVFFVDPPYTVAGRRLYNHSEIDHERLFETMASVRGAFLLTYDDAPEVRSWARDAGFDAGEVAMKSRQHSRKTELLIGRDLSWLGA
jgi:DNA adenine methylase